MEKKILEKGALLYSGKTKSLYASKDKNYVIVDFRDDTTAFDGAKHEKLSNKGITNNKINAVIMQYLEENGIPTSFSSITAEDQSLMKHLTMIPLENVVRNIATGSLCKRLGVQDKLELNPPLHELFLKSDELHDPMVNENHALSFGWATKHQLDSMKEYSIKIHKILTEWFKSVGLILVDAKYEFGVDSDGKVYLGDEVTPDSCRIWDIETNKSLDKDRFRKDLGGVIDAYTYVLEKLLESRPTKK